MRDQENVAKPPQLAQTGWCGQELFDHTTPSAPSEEASRLLLDVAHPCSCRGGEPSHNDTRVSLRRVQNCLDWQGPLLPNRKQDVIRADKHSTARYGR